LKTSLSPGAAANVLCPPRIRERKKWNEKKYQSNKNNRFSVLPLQVFELIPYYYYY